MKPANLIYAAIMIGLFLSGCISMPSASVTRGEDRPAIAIAGAPAGAILEVDGISHGAASQYDADPATLLIEPGAHVVRVLLNGNVLLKRDVYVRDGETRILTIER